METDKRPFYNWLMVILINIGAIIFLVSMAIQDADERGRSISISLFKMENFIILGISILLSVAPTLISRLNSNLKNYFGYGIPILLLLPLPYFIFDIYTCTGKFCGIGSFFYAWAFGLSAVIFAIFYVVGIYSRRWNSKSVLALSLIIPILIVEGLWILIMH